jgi:hypothetical protein
VKVTVSILSAVAAVLMTAGAAQAAQQSDLLVNGRSTHGLPVSGAAADKVVNVKEGGSINVDCGQIVEFRDGAKTFTWKFDSAQHRAVNLAVIAPEGFANKNFTVHVSRNESEGS